MNYIVLKLHCHLEIKSLRLGIINIISNAILIMSKNNLHLSMFKKRPTCNIYPAYITFYWDAYRISQDSNRHLRWRAL